MGQGTAGGVGLARRTVLLNGFHHLLGWQQQGRGGEWEGGSVWWVGQRVGALRLAEEGVGMGCCDVWCGGRIALRPNN